MLTREQSLHAINIMQLLAHPSIRRIGGMAVVAIPLARDLLKHNVRMRGDWGLQHHLFWFGRGREYFITHNLIAGYRDELYEARSIIEGVLGALERHFPDYDTAVLLETLQHVQRTLRDDAPKILIGGLAYTRISPSVIKIDTPIPPTSHLLISARCMLTGEYVADTLELEDFPGLRITCSESSLSDVALALIKKGNQ